MRLQLAQIKAPLRRKPFMPTESLDNWRHRHDFAVHNPQGERRTFYVLILTAITMVIEIIAGTVYGSMALLADGWHMSTHVAAFLIATFAYRYARAHADNPAYAFGTGKVNVLGGFASAVALAVVALMMLIESLERVVNPTAIAFNEAIAVASLGLAVNVISALLLKHDHHHHHGHEHHDHDHHHDHNLRAAYIHVLADALTSLLAIMALLSGKYFGWAWMDPIMGIVGAIIITRWSWGLLMQTSPVLLDASIDADYLADIRQAIEHDADNQVTDLHIWRVSANHYAAIIALVTRQPRASGHYRELLADFHRLSHVTIEVHQHGNEVKGRESQGQHSP